MRLLLSEDEIPKRHLRDVKCFSSAFEFVTGRLDSFNTCITILEHGGTYKMIRSFELADVVSVSVDILQVNRHEMMAKLLMMDAEE